MTVRRVRTGPAGAEERARAGELVVTAYAPFLLGPDDPYAARLRDVEGRDAEAEVWVEVAPDGTPRGCVTYAPPGSALREVARGGPGEPPVEGGGRLDGEFRMLAVDPAARGRGVGARLVAAMVARARADGADALVLSSLPEMVEAHRLYERLGFVRTPDRDHRPLPHVPLMAYVLPLG